ncbi:TolC family protein [Thiohalorhabdus sp. Cl-TMA]|uniref:TolC family protein n=1 Tax=Thiohalorhabdus methylotrophus TaxID=3242694 RepID=A0ABV4TZ52_9GAMM
MRFILLPFLGLLGTGLLVAAQAHAQDLPAPGARVPRVAENPKPTEPPSPLGLEAAIHWAVEHHPAIRRARSQVDERKGKALQADRWFPEDAELAVKGDIRSTVDNGESDISVRLGQPLWIAGQGQFLASAARARVRGAERHQAYTHALVTARTRQAFLQALVAQEAVRMVQRTVRRTRDFRSALLRGPEELSPMARNAVDVAAHRVQAALVRMKRRQEHARLALLEQLALPPDVNLEIRGRLAAPPLQLPERETLMKAALRRRQDLAEVAQEVVAEREDLKLARRRRIPNPTIYWAYSVESGDRQSRLGVSFPFSLRRFQRGSRQAAAEQVTQAEVSQEALRLTIRRQVHEAITDYRAARQLVDILRERTYRKAAESLDQALRRFRAGSMGPGDITATLDNLMTVRQEHIEALQELVAAGTALEQATGGLLVMGQYPSSQAENRSTLVSHGKGDEE